MLKAINLHNISLEQFKRLKYQAADKLGQLQVPKLAAELLDDQSVDIWQRSDFMVQPAHYVFIEMLRQLLLPNFEKLKGVHIAAIYGLYLLYLKDACGVSNTLGVDISQFNTRVAAEVGAPVIRADAMQLPVADQSLDFVISFHLMELGYMKLDSIDAILGEINRVLKPGGIFLSELESFNDRDVYLEQWASLGNTTLGVKTSLFSQEISKIYPLNLLYVRAFRKE